MADDHANLSDEQYWDLRVSAGRFFHLHFYRDANGDPIKAEPEELPPPSDSLRPKKVAWADKVEPAGIDLTE